MSPTFQPNFNFIGHGSQVFVGEGALDFTFAEQFSFADPHDISAMSYASNRQYL